jgi:hypothetical protein
MAVTRSNRSPQLLYKIFDWFLRTPLNGWLLILLLIPVGALFNHWPYWQSGLIPKFQLEPELLFAATWFSGNIGVWLATDRIAKSTLTDFGKGVGKSDKEIAGMYNDFVSVPQPWATIITIGAIAFALLQAFAEAKAAGLQNTGLILVSAVWPVLGAILESLAVVRIFRQLVLVNRLYKEIKKVNLFNLWPVYALSRFGYTIAFYFILFTVVFYALINLITGTGFGLSEVIYTALISILVFVAPLFGINARLRRAKEHELQRLGTELNAVYAEAETAVHKRKLDKVGGLRTAAGAMREQIEAVQKVATWPWNPGSMRNLLLPVLLPLFIAVLQRYVLSFLGF